MQYFSQTSANLRYGKLRSAVDTAHQQKQLENLTSENDIDFLKNQIAAGNELRAKETAEYAKLIAKKEISVAAEKELRAKETAENELKLAKLTEENELKLAKLTEENELKLAKLTAEMEMKDIMNRKDGKREGNFDTIDIPHDVQLEDDVLEEARNLIDAFNRRPGGSHEKSCSILKEDSVHHLWKRLLELVLTSDRKSAAMIERRVAYEWSIRHPITTDSQQRLDFTFISGYLSHLNWFDYAGGLELKVSPQRPSESGSKSGSNVGGKMACLGRAQALSRAAMCVYARWVASGKSGEHVACCCFADSRKFGVSRVRINEQGIVCADVYGPIDLPGFNNSTDPTALLILKHLLTSPADVLNELMSEFVATPDELSGQLIMPLSDHGGDEGVVAEETKWALGSFLGAGGFAVVYAAGDNNQSVDVIKMIMSKENAYRMQNEFQILSQLANVAESSNSGCFPKIKGALKNGEMVVALKMSPRGITMTQYLRLINYSIAQYGTLVRRMGPAMVRALRSAHDVSIAHQDVRPLNILLVPEIEVMDALACAGGDFVEEEKVIRLINLDTCTFVLNDWGEAVQFKNVGDRTKKDLASLVRTLDRLCCAPNLTDVSVSASPITIVAVPGRPLLKAEIRRKLMEYTEVLNYDGIIEVLEKNNIEDLIEIL